MGNGLTRTKFGLIIESHLNNRDSFFLSSFKKKKQKRKIKPRTVSHTQPTPPKKSEPQKPQNQTNNQKTSKQTKTEAKKTVTCQFAKPFQWSCRKYCGYPLVTIFVGLAQNHHIAFFCLLSLNFLILSPLLLFREQGTKIPPCDFLLATWVWAELHFQTLF